MDEFRCHQGLGEEDLSVLEDLPGDETTPRGRKPEEAKGTTKVPQEEAAHEGEET